MMKRLKISDPLERLRKIGKEIGSDVSLRHRKRVRLFLIAPVLLNLGLRLAGVKIWGPAQIILHALTAFWLMDWVIVLLGAVTGVFAVPDVPVRRRTILLFRAILRSYLQPQTAWQSVNAALRDAREAHLGPKLLRRAEGLPDRIYFRVKALVEAGKADDARLYLNKETQELDRLTSIHMDLRRKARKAYCESLVKPHLATGNTIEAERILVRVNIVLVAAAELRIEKEIVELVFKGRLDEAEQWISRTRRDRARERAYAALTERVDATPIEHQGYLRRLLKELDEFEYESREYRKARYLLDKEIDKTKRPPE